MSRSENCPRAIMVDLGEFKNLLSELLQKFYPVELSDEVLYDLVIAMFEFHIDKYLLWCKTTDLRLNREVQRHIPWLEPGVDEYYANRFEDMVLDPMADRILQYLHYVIRGATWDVVTIKRRKSTGIISRGEDYRILDWHRLQEQQAHESENVHDLS